jgi:selenocysteine-specific elongation factor
MLDTGVRVLDVRPHPLRRRGAARVRTAELAGGVPDAATLLRWHGPLRTSELAAMGSPPSGRPVAGEWHVDPTQWSSLRDQLIAVVAAHERDHPLDGGLPITAARQALGLPADELVQALVRSPLRLSAGRIRSTDEPSRPVRRAVRVITDALGDRPFQAPEATWLAEHDIGAPVLAAAARDGLLVRLADHVVLLPDAPQRAAERLAALPQPFTASEARQALATTRRVVIPLLEHLDAAGLTQRIDDRHRSVR